MILSVFYHFTSRLFVIAMHYVIESHVLKNNINRAMLDIMCIFN